MEIDTTEFLPVSSNTIELEDTNEDKRITTRYMTKYEKARILGTRALQIRYRKHLRLV